MATLEKTTGAELKPREDLEVIGAIASPAGTLDCPNEGGSLAIIDVRGTFAATLELVGTRNGTDWLVIPIQAEGSNSFAPTITATGVYFAFCQGFDVVRVRAAAYTSGQANIYLATSLTSMPVGGFVRPEPCTLVARTYGAANTATTLTINAAGANLFHYLHRILVKRVNESAAAITASAALSITTTNLPGTLSWVVGNAINAWAHLIDVDETLPSPVRSSAANTNTTIVVPAAGAGVRAEVMVFYKVGR